MLPVMCAVTVLLLAPESTTAVKMGVTIVSKSKGTMELDCPIGRKGEGVRCLRLRHAHSYFATALNHVEHRSGVIKVRPRLLQTS